MDSFAIFAVDVGGPKKFAWVASSGAQGEDGESLVRALLSAFVGNKRVALGFECPLFIPVPREWKGIGKARVGEYDRAWSGGAGATVTTYGLHEVAWVLNRLRCSLSKQPPLFVSPEPWLKSSDVGLLLWEAFVSGKDKGRNHQDDVKRAAHAFGRLLDRNAWEAAREVTVGSDRFPMNLAALAADWAGWPVNPADLRSELLVVKPDSA